MESPKATFLEMPLHLTTRFKSDRKPARRLRGELNVEIVVLDHPLM